MPDAIDTTDGISSAVFAREDAWHQLGTVLPDSFTAEQAMEAGHLGGWNVRKIPVAAVDGDAYLPMPGRNAVVRDNPVVPGRVDVIGDVGDAYRIVQNEEHAQFLNTLVDESGAHFETAGALDGGRLVFLTMKVPGHMLLGGIDKIDLYLAAINSHDGSMAFSLYTTPVRIVCKNTLNVSISGANNIFKVRHTRGVNATIAAEARAALDLSFNYLDAFQAEANALIDTTLTEMKFEEILKREFGAPEDAAKATVTRSDKKIEEMLSLFADASTQDGIRNTAWAGFNAITEWADHFSPTRGDERDEARARKAVLAPQFKTRALDIMRDYTLTVTA
jgi:phage/plasmid-like protein (TIGR03299 family)